MTAWYDRISDTLRHLLFPRRCVLCGRTAAQLSAKSPLCGSCTLIWNRTLSEPCAECGRPGAFCRCVPRAVRENTETYGRLPIRFYHLFPYRQGGSTPAARIVLRLKKKNDADAVRFLASQLVPLCECAAYELTGNGSYDEFVITYTPRSKKAAADAGFDQSGALAYALSRETNIPVLRCFDRVSGQNTAQKQLDSAARQENARKSYRLHPRVDVRGKRVILVDDILTTGATLCSCASLLFAAGAAACVCITAAQTELERKETHGKRYRN